MNPTDYARSELRKSAELIQLMLSDSDLLGRVVRAAEICSSAIGRGNKVMFCGNGGSAADAQHLAAELVGKLVHPRPAMPGLALTTDSSALTAIGNDFGYDEVFARQLEGLGRAGDVLIGISTSGRSRNVVRAFEAARKLSISTVALTGRTHGPMAELADLWLAVPHDETPKIQEGHIALGHIFCSIVESTIYKQPA